MSVCDRCGIGIPGGTVCPDCVEYWGGIVYENATLVKRADGTGYVRSGRRAGTNIADRQSVLNQVHDLHLQGLSGNQIALKVGVSSRTVQRMRAELGLLSTVTGRDGWSDPDTQTDQNFNRKASA